MKLSELVADLNRVMEEKGDMGVFIGDMRGVEVEVVDAIDTERYGKCYLHISENNERG